MIWLEPSRLAGKQWAVSWKVCESQVVAGLQCQAGHLGLVWRKGGCSLGGPEQRGDVISSVL